MSDIIRLLPDSVANQIAAGEVIQRPASAVKELLENAVDAGADRIQLIISDAGKTLIQTIDNGCGMSENDARMCFERHATSKISNADDLFALHTKGFRGEAMASIAAIAQVELKSRSEANELGIEVHVAGSKTTKQEPCQTPIGTSIAVKNLFFNVPARRNFLKSNAVETRHILDEFHRVALAHTQIEMSLHQDGDEIYHLPKAKLRQRIVDIFGKAFNEKLVPVEEETTIASIKGFIGKPEFARKSRGEQFFFVNDRFIRSNYLNHALTSAYADLIAEKSYPAYFIFFQVDPKSIDINIHPTKTEVKFEDERSVYAILRSAVRQSLGKYNISPTLDFEQETSITFPPPPKNVQMVQPQMPLRGNSGSGGNGSNPHSDAMRRSRSEWDSGNENSWQQLYEGLDGDLKQSQTTTVQSRLEVDDNTDIRPVQLHGKYILSSIRSGTVIIDQKRAHQRVLFERMIRSMALQDTPAQQLLFPINLELSAADVASVKQLLPELKLLGVELETFGKGGLIVQGVAPFLDESRIPDILDEVIEEMSQTGGLSGTKRQERIARAMARKAAMDHGRKLQPEEMMQLIDELFACDQPYAAPNGKPTMVTLSLDELEKRFA